MQENFHMTTTPKRTARELAKSVAKVRREAKARANLPDPNWPGRFKKLEAELLKARPHLALHKHCGLCPDTEKRPTKRVIMPNGFVLHTTWYKVPTTDADSRKASAEQRWLKSLSYGRAA